MTTHLSTIRCAHCGAEVSNGLALCELCQRKVLLDLEFIPVYFRNLARWKPGHAGSRPVPGSRVLYDGVERGVGTGDRISDRLDETLGAFPESEEAARLRANHEAANALTTWARVLADARPYLAKLLDRLAAARVAERVDDAEAMAWLCRGFTKYLTSVSTLEWCGEFARDLAHHEARLRALTEASVPGWYAGACTRKISMEAHCGASTYVVPGLTWVTCGSCGVTTNASDHLDTILEEARGWVAPPMRLAEALVALVDTEVSITRLHKRVSKWGERGRIETLRRVDADGDDVGPKRYRLGQVLDLLLTEGVTRPDVDVEVVAS